MSGPVRRGGRARAPGARVLGGRAERLVAPGQTWLAYPERDPVDAAAGVLRLFYEAPRPDGADELPLGMPVEVEAVVAVAGVARPPRAVV